MRFLFSEVSSEIIGMLAVISLILLDIILFTSISPLLTGVPSNLIFFVSPCFLKSNEIFPASKKVSYQTFNDFFNVFAIHLLFLILYYLH